MIRAGFLDEAIRDELTALMRDGREETRVARRANALLLLDDGWSCQEVAEALYMDDDTRRDIDIAKERFAQLTKEAPMNKTKSKSYESVWDAIADPPAQVAHEPS